MQYNASTPEGYIKLLQDDWRKEKLLEIREMILSQAPELNEGIEYKMLGFANDQGQFLCHLNAQKNYVSLYVGNINKIDSEGYLLSGLDLGKGCIRIKKSIELTKTNLQEFITQALAYWRAGGDIGC